MTHKKKSLAVMLCVLATACASHDYRDVQLLGAATDANISRQSVRDVDTPNFKAIEGGKGGSAAAAVSALRNEKAG